jgi:DNA repair exonuclease SbcCD ATPase subunit
VILRLHNLSLNCKQKTEQIDLNHQITFFHGQIGAGKSSILRLVDFALGASLQRTVAIQQEVLSVDLSITVGTNEVVVYRSINADRVDVSWRTKEGEYSSLSAPITASNTPILGDKVYSYSDLIFYLMGMEPIMVRKAKTNPESELIRLSFRDFMWYCYLEQEELDSSFFNLHDPFRRLKSRDVLRYVTGYYSDRIAELEELLEATRDGRLRAEGTIEQLQAIIKELGFESREQVRAREASLRTARGDTQVQLVELRGSFKSVTHETDNLRDELRRLGQEVNDEEQLLEDLRERIVEQQRLRSELIATKMKAVRTTAAVSLLSGVRFGSCPACGQDVRRRKVSDDACCYLCTQCLEKDAKSGGAVSQQLEETQADLSTRIEDISLSIESHTAALSAQKRRVDALRREKAEKDSALGDALADYDSAFLSRFRALERRAATLGERLERMEQLLKFCDRLDSLRLRLLELDGRLAEIRKSLREERATLTSAQDNVRAIEDKFLDAMLQIGFPGVYPDDKVTINLTTWIPQVLSHGSDEVTWNFWNAGSGGKKTLFNVCFALAVHTVAAERSLPLPTLLMIDTPMKNIGEDVNRELFEAFYHYLYRLAQRQLSSTQIVLVDKDFIRSPDVELDLAHRFMTPNDDAAPPLITYYRGS